MHVAEVSPALDAVTVTSKKKKSGARYVEDEVLSDAPLAIGTDVGDNDPNPGLLVRATEMAALCGTGLA